MTHFVRALVWFSAALLLIGCSSMVAIDDVPASGTINRDLTKEQIGKAIEDGAFNAGWIPKDIGNDQIMASYRVRSHSVLVMIEYSEDIYNIRYSSSREMKVQCTEADHKAAPNIIVTGRQSCPGLQKPLYIHANYGPWIANLKHSIDQAILFAD